MNQKLGFTHVQNVDLNGENSKERLVKKGLYIT